MTKQLTPIGRWLREFRLENDMLLKDMADDLAISSAHLSGIETGRKPVPSKFIEKLIQAYRLPDGYARKLEDLKAESSSEYNIRAVPSDRRDVAAALARRFNELPDADLHKIRDILNRRRG